MKKYSFLFAVLLFASSLLATPKDSTIYYNLPDSVKAVQFMAELDLANIQRTKNFKASVTTSIVSLSIIKVGRVFQISFNCLLGSNPTEIITGYSVEKQVRAGHLFFPYTLQPKGKYKLLISLANDSASNTSIYSGYTFLPGENRWKLIGSFKFNNRWHYIQEPSVFIETHKKSGVDISLKEALVQSNRGIWKNLTKQETTTPPPTINLYSHIDSLQQHYIETKQIQDSIAAGKTDATKSYNGIFFTMLKEGTGPQVAVTDTVVAHYKGYLFSDGTVFDQTKDKPATFPLSRLIKGWQMGLPLCKVGGKIKLLIPSDLAYSIRTRAAKIPPNSILVFEIEVLDAKPAYK